MGHNWPVVILGGVFRAAGSGATLPPPPSPDESFRTSKKLPVHETCFYLRVFKVNLNQEKLYLAPSHSPPIRFSSAFLLSFLPPTSFLVPCAASSSLHEHHFSRSRLHATSIFPLSSNHQGSRASCHPHSAPRQMSFTLSSSLCLSLCQDPSCEPLS